MTKAENIDKYQKRAKLLVRMREREGVEAIWKKSRKIYDLDWDMPEGLEEVEYVHKVVNTDGRDVIDHAARIYTPEEPLVEIDPWAYNKATLKRVNSVENFVKWQFDLMLQRSEEDLQREVMFNALMNDMIVGQLEYLPWQEDVLNSMSENRRKGALRLGEYVLNLIDPSNAYVRFSNHGIEEAVLRYVMDFDTFKDKFGAMAETAIDNMKVSEDEGRIQNVTVWDYFDYERRVVWAYAQEDPTVSQMEPTEDAGAIVMNEVHNLPFLPVVAVRGGKTPNPLLKSLADSGQWETVCSLETAIMTETTSMAWAPRYVIKGPDGKNIKIIYGAIGSPLSIDEFHDVEPLPPPQLDESSLLLLERERQKMEKSTMSSVLQGYTPESNVAFAAINTATASALKVLNPYRRLMERFWTKIFMQMLEWKQFAEDDLNVGRDGKVKGKSLPVDRMYMRVKLQPDVPQDWQQKINTAVQALQIGMSKGRAMEKAGISDPTSVLYDARREAFEDVQTQSELAIEQARGALKAQLENAGLGMLAQMANDPEFIQMLQQLQQQILQQQAGGGGGGAPPAPAGAGNPADPSRPPGLAEVEGQGFAGNAGGQNTAEVAPGATRETQSGQDRGGLGLG